MSVGEDITALWLGAGHFSGYLLLAIFSGVVIIETYSFTLSTASRATEEEAFAIPMLAAGFLKLGLAFLFMRAYGPPGLAFSTLAAQLAIPAWYVPRRSLRRLEIPASSHFRESLLPVLGVFAANLILANALVHALDGAPPIARVIAVCLGAGFTLAIAAFYLVLPHSLRKRILPAFAVSGAADRRP
jgi:hypothetical protein